MTISAPSRGNQRGRLMKKHGTVLDIEAHSKKVYFENKTHVVGTLQDVTERKKAEDLNKYLAYHDPLTDLPNLRLFYEWLEQELLISKLKQRKFSVMDFRLGSFQVCE